jgi:hypothetical protein
MPPSPGVDKLELTEFKFADTSLEAKVVPVLNDWGKGIIRRFKQAGRQQELYHRSRAAAIAWGPFRMREFEHRLQRLSKHSKWLEEIRWPPGLSVRYNTSYVRNVLRHMKFDWGYIQAYVKDHKASSVSPGVKWSNLLMNVEEWKELYEALRAMLELHEHDEAPVYRQRPMNVGLRARAPGITGDLGRPIVVKVDRCRVVLFSPDLSTWAAFMPNKPGWYESTYAIVDEICDDMDLASLEWVSGATHGGKIYTQAADWFTKYRHFDAYDIGSAESVVGPTFEHGMAWMFIPIGGYVHLPSGQVGTTALDSSLAIYLARKMQTRYGGSASLIHQGDDVNIFHEGKAWPDYGLLERQPQDSNLGFVLGVAFRPDVQYPHILGFKYSGDRADKAKRLFESSEFRDDEALINELGERERKLWYNLWFGKFGDWSLLQAVKRIKPERYRGGTEELVAFLEELEAADPDALEDSEVE